MHSVESWSFHFLFLLQFFNNPISMLNNFALLIFKVSFYVGVFAIGNVNNNAPSLRGKRPNLAGVAPIPRSARLRKDRQPNWSPLEMVALIAAKREQYFEELDVVNGHDLMNLDASKWVRISHLVMATGQSPCMRDGPACKAKWNQIIPDYKRIVDYHARMGRNLVDYWELSTSEHTTNGLPKTF
jgi:hypothetical protein